jgi:transposase InsO family protein
MPWQETSTMSLRREFCALASQPGANMSELCRRYGISRKTGYKWVERYRAEGVAGLVERSRRPRTMPRLTADALTERVLALRDAHPTWGGRKLRRRLEDLGEPAPAASTITAILRRAGRIDPAEAARHTAWQRFEHAAPNDLWQMDFKGDVALPTGRCHPLHVLDDHSRYVLGLVACPNQRCPTVQDALTAIFTQHGLPWRLLCDNGAPWGSVHAPSGVTTLTAWLLRLGIDVVHGRPYHPQTQGKLERANRTLAADVLAIPRYPDLAACQRAFDAWRDCYNHERPHEALDLRTPSAAYAASPRPFPTELPPIVYEPDDQIRMVQRSGEAEFQARTLFVSEALVGQPVAFRATTTDGRWEVYFCHRRIRTVDLHAIPRGATESPETV